VAEFVRHRGEIGIIWIDFHPVIFIARDPVLVTGESPGRRTPQVFYSGFDVAEGRIPVVALERELA
jgi:hypothetical protein